MKLRTIAAIPLIALALAACGGTTGPSNRPVDPRDIVLTASHIAESSSFRADMSVELTLQVFGPKADLFSSVTEQPASFTARLTQQTQQRSSIDFTFVIKGRTVVSRVTFYDGALYVSTDGGSTYKTVPINGIPRGQYGPQSALQYLDSVGTVHDVGAGTADGVSVEKYSGQLDPAELVGIVKSVLSAFKSGPYAKFLDAIESYRGDFDASVDHSGRLVVERAAFEGLLDFSVVDPSLNQTFMRFHETVVAHFHDYGAAISVPRPTNVTGALSLP